VRISFLINDFKYTHTAFITFLEFHVGLPTEEQRLKILKLILEHENISSDVNFIQLAKITNTFSGSDLRELCRNASVYRIRSFIRDGNVLAEGEEETRDNKILPEIKMEDLMTSYQKMKLSKMHTGLLSLEMRSDLD
jgi:ATPase family AAA domain-containing protein 1